MSGPRFLSAICKEEFMSTMRETAEKFFHACEGGKGWEAWREFCTGDATFSAQAPAIADIKTLEAYTEWIKGLGTPMPGSSYEIQSFGVDEKRGSALVYSVFTGTHSGEGGPVPATGKTTSTDYVYVMQFADGKISGMTKIWNDGFCLAELGWM